MCDQWAPWLARGSITPRFLCSPPKNWKGGPSWKKAEDCQPFQRDREEEILSRQCLDRQTAGPHPQLERRYGVQKCPSGIYFHHLH